MRTTFFDTYSKNKHITNDYIIISKQLNESLLDVRTKNAKGLSDNDFSIIISCDPLLSDLTDVSEETLANTPESYSKWLVNMYKRGELQTHSPSEIREYLKLFNQAKNRRNLLPNNDINSYQTFDSIVQALSNLGDLSVRQKNRDAKKNQNELKGKKKPGIYMNGNVELLFNGNDWEVWTPLTFEGSKALRRGASWCTGGDDPDWYNSYNENGMLYVIIPTNEEYKTEKYQLFIPEPGSSKSYEFRDENNDEMSFRKICHENTELLSFFNTVHNMENSYPNLDDPDLIDKEWSQEKEQEVVFDYGLGCDDDGNVRMSINYNTLLNYGYYITPRDIEEVAISGELHVLSCSIEKQKELKSAIIKNSNMINNIDWKFTPMGEIYDTMMEEIDINATDEDISFEEFMQIIVDENYQAGLFSRYAINWLKSKNPNFRQLWFDCISSEPIIKCAEKYIIDELENLEWNEDLDTYLYEELFTYPFDVYSYKEFYEDITHNGELTYGDILDEYNIYFKENTNKLESGSRFIEIYTEGEYYLEDMYDFKHKLMGKNNLNNNYDSEINEVLKIAGIKD